MEIISYLKGKKAQKSVAELHKTVGQDAYKNGIRDVADLWTDADERIEKLESKHGSDVLNDRIESLTELVAINLNKHHLFVGMQAKKQYTKHEQLVFQDFDSTSDYVASKSSNVSLMTGGIKPTSALKDGILVLKPEPAHQLMKLIVMTSHSNNSNMEIPLPLTDIIEMHQVELVSGRIQFVKKDTTYNTYHGEGSILFKPLELAEALTVRSALHNLTMQSSDVKWLYALSKDGVTYSDYKPLISGEVIEGFVLIKVEFTNGSPAVGTKTVNQTAVALNSLTEIASSAVQLKQNHTLAMSVDNSWTNDGTLFRVPINKKQWSILNGISAM